MYTIVVDGKPQGPYTLAQLKTLPLRPDTFVRKPGMDDYKEAHELEELRELMGFHFQKTAPQYFASFDQRLLAAAIDYFLIAVLYALILLLVFWVVQEKSQRIQVAITGLLFVPLVKFIYSVFAEASAKQATIGKKLLDIKVGDEQGNRISVGMSFIRNLSKIISVMTLGFGYLYCFLNKRQQCLHDVMANTLVVKQRLL
ncbi:RDD family protein [Pedobacter sp. ASV28]|uniref:RDD family protein n=1 Tax=Pedobacter sp. ASV28 TaxID=2795123 RepID=UPI0018EC250B|nr:RDD family protein [Pedobacter sp. ASV28]